jgi:hypothetical protein
MLVTFVFIISYPPFEIIRTKFCALLSHFERATCSTYHILCHRNYKPVLRSIHRGSSVSTMKGLGLKFMFRQQYILVTTTRMAGGKIQLFELGKSRPQRKADHTILQMLRSRLVGAIFSSLPSCYLMTGTDLSPSLIFKNNLVTSINFLLKWKSNVK